MTFRLSPDRKFLKVNFGYYEKQEEPEKESWLAQFQRLTNGSTVVHIQLNSGLVRDELKPFLELPTLKHLTISGAKVYGDTSEILTTARREIVIDQTPLS